MVQVYSKAMPRQRRIASWCFWAMTLLLVACLNYFVAHSTFIKDRADQLNEFAFATFAVTPEEILQPHPMSWLKNRFFLNRTQVEKMQSVWPPHTHPAIYLCYALLLDLYIRWIVVPRSRRDAALRGSVSVLVPFMTLMTPPLLLAEIHLVVIMLYYAHAAVTVPLSVCLLQLWSVDFPVDGLSEIDAAAEQLVDDEQRKID